MYSRAGELRRDGHALLAAPVAILLSFAAAAYGPEGHLIAGQAAEPLLCERAADEVASLAGGEGLGEIGLWADRIRSDERYAHAAPWHYINVADGESLAAIEHPPEGDVLWAIERFTGRLGDDTLDRNAREEALRFLVHFIVDLHQPVHVGLAEDRGGNEVDLVFRGEETNLHRFWDTHAIELAGLSVGGYVLSLDADDGGDSVGSLDPRTWARESLDLRPAVYGFGEAGREPPADYLEFAARVTRERLTLAAGRLAGTLNALLCVAG